jgi:O-antigen/teichoic acid export membrane protein
MSGQEVPEQGTHLRGTNARLGSEPAASAAVRAELDQGAAKRSADMLATQAARGATTTFLWQAVRVLTQLVATVVLARMLSPHDFGLFAMVIAVIGVGEVLRDLGLTMAAVQAPSLSQAQKSNLFWINLTAGLLLTGTAYAASGLIADFYNETDLTVIAQTASLTFVLNSAATQFRAELNRNMRFMALNVLDTLPQVLGLAAGVWVALVSRSFWALLVQQLVVASTGLILAIAIARWWPGFPRRRADMGSLLRFGGGVIGTQLLTYIARNVDNVALGYSVGPASLGAYSRAYQVLEMPITQLSAPISRVAIPVLVRLVDQPRRYVRYLRAGQLVGSLGVGIIFGIAAGLADPLVLLVFGPQWQSMAVLMQVLALGGAFRAMNQVVFWSYMSQGKSVQLLKLNVVVQPVLVALMLLGLPWGAVGVALGHSIGHMLNWFASLWWCGRTTTVSTRDLLRDGLRNFCLFTVPTFAICLIAAESVASPLMAILLGVVLVTIYVLVLSLASPKVRSDIATMRTAAGRLKS